MRYSNVRKYGLYAVGFAALAFAFLPMLICLAGDRFPSLQTDRYEKQPVPRVNGGEQTPPAIDLVPIPDEVIRPRRMPHIRPTLLLDPDAKIISVPRRVQWKAYYAKWCKKCHFGLHDFPDWLRASDWDVSDTDQAHVRLIDGDLHPDLVRSGKVLDYPTYILEVDGQEIYRTTDYPGRKVLVDRYLAAVAETSKIVTSRPAPKNRSFGTLHARHQVQEWIAWHKSHIADSIPRSDAKQAVAIELTWLRTGGQTFALLHMKKEQWTARNIYGALGEFRLTAHGAKNPLAGIDEGRIGYRVEKDRDGMWRFKLTGEVDIAADRLGLPGDVDPVVSASAREAPAGFGPAAILTVITLLNDVWSLLHPTCDLQLGGSMACKASLFEEAGGEVLVIDFSDAPMIKFSALFHFNLTVKQLEVSPTKIVAHTEGSMLVSQFEIAVVE